MGILGTGARALLANQLALQTAGNNIANVNTPGYSRQQVILQTVQGQYTGSGYIGNGVSIETIQRNFSAFLNRQSTLASSISSADSTRSDKLKQLEELFAGGTDGLGASISDMLNAFSDVASAPTDLTARTVVLTRVDETAARMRAASTSLDDLQAGVGQELDQKVTAINSLTKNIAAVNAQISLAQGAGQPPNDLLDHRDQLIRELNQYVQTTSIAATDGSIGLFIGGSQALVLGTDATPVSIVTDDFGDTLKNKLAITRNGQTITLDENTLGGGEVSGLLRFQNSDLNEGRNLLGRLTLAISTAMNDQHKLGLDLDGNVGSNLFSPTVFGAQNVREPIAPALLNTGNATMTLAINDSTKFVASDYEVNFTSGSTGSITRRSDGVVFTFPQTPPTTAPILATLDGLDISIPAGTPATGDRFLLKPFSTSATNIRSVFSTPRALAVANPVAATTANTNKGSLTVAGVIAKNLATPIDNFSINFSVVAGVTTYDIVDNTTLATVATAQPFLSGQPITYAPAGAAGWSLTLTGAPADLDTVTVKPNPFPGLNGGNASAMLTLRDAAMFDGGPLTDGYAGLISQIGIRTQSASYASQVSSSIASNLETDRAGVSGVNLDEEAAKLLQFQQAYQASAKMIQIAQSIFDTLLQGLSR